MTAQASFWPVVTMIPGVVFGHVNVAPGNPSHARTLVPPTETDATPLVRPGTSKAPVGPPASGQHLTPPDVVTAHVCDGPADMSDTPVKPLTASGLGLFAEPAPFPSWPWASYPQQSTKPVAMTAQVWPHPADTAIAASGKGTRA